MNNIHEARKVWDALVTPTLMLAAAGATWLVLSGAF
jgi:hypothetical protein